MSVEISYRDQATGQPNGASCSYRAPRPGEQVVIVIDGPPQPPAEACHVCCSPGQRCPCAERKEPFCECDHGWATCPGCAVALAPEASHAEGCEWLAGVQAGLEAVRQGRTIPWDEVKQELGIEDATQSDNPAGTPGSYGDGLHHTHLCPTCNTEFPCAEEHAPDSLFNADLARLHHPAPTTRPASRCEGMTCRDSQCLDQSHWCEACILGGHRHCAQGGCRCDWQPTPEPGEGTAVKVPPYHCAPCLQGFHTNCHEGSCRCDFDAYAEENLAVPATACASTDDSVPRKHRNW